jgi:hypothetical protein
MVIGRIANVQRAQRVDQPVGVGLGSQARRLDDHERPASKLPGELGRDGILRRRAMEVTSSSKPLVQARHARKISRARSGARAASPYRRASQPTPPPMD